MAWDVGETRTYTNDGSWQNINLDKGQYKITINGAGGGGGYGYPDDQSGNGGTGGKVVAEFKTDGTNIDVYPADSGGDASEDSVGSGGDGYENGDDGESDSEGAAEAWGGGGAGGTGVRESGVSGRSYRAYGGGGGGGHGYSEIENSRAKSYGGDGYYDISGGYSGESGDDGTGVIDESIFDNIEHLSGSTTEGGGNSGDGEIKLEYLGQEFDMTIDIDGQGSELNYGEGTHRVLEEESVTLEADPDTDWYFDEWSGHKASTATEITFDMPDEDITQTAIFKEMFELQVNIHGGGDVTDHEDTTFNDRDTKEYEESEATLTANADSDFYFEEWVGDKNSTSEQITITMDSDKTVTCAFYETGKSDVDTQTDWEYITDSYGNTEIDNDRLKLGYDKLEDSFEYSDVYDDWSETSDSGSDSYIETTTDYSTDGDRSLRAHSPATNDSALDFESDYTGVQPTSSGKYEFTFDKRVDSDQNGAGDPQFGIKDDNDDYIQIKSNLGGNFVLQSTFFDQVDTGLSVSKNTWYSIKFVIDYEDDDVTLYIDGNEEASASLDGNSLDSSSSRFKGFVNKWSGRGSYADFWIDNIKVTYGSSSGTWSSIIWDDGISDKSEFKNFSTDVYDLPSGAEVDVKLLAYDSDESTVLDESDWKNLSEGSNDVNFDISNGYYWELEYEFAGGGTIESYSLETTKAGFDIYIDGERVMEITIDNEDVTDVTIDDTYM